jgi:hypothetical protein
MPEDIVVGMLRQGIKARDQLVSSFIRTTGLPDIPIRGKVTEAEMQVVNTLEKVSPANLMEGISQSVAAAGLPGLPELPGVPSVNTLPVMQETSVGRLGEPKGRYKTIEGESTRTVGKVYRGIK